MHAIMHWFHDEACYSSVELLAVIVMLEWFWNSYNLFSAHSSKTSCSTLQCLWPLQGRNSGNWLILLQRCVYVLC